MQPELRISNAFTNADLGWRHPCREQIRLTQVIIEKSKTPKISRLKAFDLMKHGIDEKNTIVNGRIEPTVVANVGCVENGTITDLL